MHGLSTSSRVLSGAGTDPRARERMNRERPCRAARGSFQAARRRLKCPERDDDHDPADTLVRDSRGGGASPTSHPARAQLESDARGKTCRGQQSAVSSRRTGSAQWPAGHDSLNPGRPDTAFTASMGSRSPWPADSSAKGTARPAPEESPAVEDGDRRDTTTRPRGMKPSPRSRPPRTESLSAATGIATDSQAPRSRRPLQVGAL